VCVCVCVCAYIYIQAVVHFLMCVEYIYIYIYIYVCVCVCVYGVIYMCGHIYIYVICIGSSPYFRTSRNTSSQRLPTHSLHCLVCFLKSREVTLC
jgi:hypothetical protein